MAGNVVVRVWVLDFDDERILAASEISGNAPVAQLLDAAQVMVLKKLGSVDEVPDTFPPEWS